MFKLFAAFFCFVLISCASPQNPNYRFLVWANSVKVQSACQHCCWTEMVPHTLFNRCTKDCAKVVELLNQNQKIEYLYGPKWVMKNCKENTCAYK